MTRYLSRVPASEACDPIIHPFHSIHACQTHGSPSSGYASFDIIQMQSSYAQDRARTSENLEFLDLHLRLTPSSARTKSEWDVHYEFECPWKLTCISECRPATLQRSSIRTSFNLRKYFTFSERTVQIGPLRRTHHYAMASQTVGCISIFWFDSHRTYERDVTITIYFTHNLT